MGAQPRYDDDFLAWTEEQARLLREAASSRINLPLDFENLAEEVDGMGRSEAKAANSALMRIVEHLLKLEFSPAAAPRPGWQDSVDVHRIHLLKDLKASPSLRGKLDLADAHADARWLAARGLARDGQQAEDIPAECPYTLDRILDRDWWPANRHGLED